MSGEQAIGEPLGGADRSDHRRVLQPRRQAARRRAVRRGRRSCTTRRRDGRLSGSTATRSSPPSPSLPTGSTSPSERSTGRFGSSIRRAGRLLLARSTRGTQRVWQVAFSPDGELLAVAVDPNGGGDGFYGQQRQGEVQLWDVGSRSRVGRKIVPGARIGARRGLQPGRHAAGDRQRAGGSTCGTWPPRHVMAQPMRVSDDGCPERRVRSDRPARRRRRCDRAGARLARFGSAAGVPSPHRTYRPDHRRGLRRGRLVSRDHEPIRRDQALGSSLPASGSARSWPEARGPARPRRRPSIFPSWGCATRSARTASCWPSRESRRSGCCGTSIPRSGASARARSWGGT